MPKLILLSFNMSDLLRRCVDAYWAKELGTQGLHSSIRMGFAVEIIAAEIRQWAPDKSQAKICHLAINEIADRLIQEVNNAKAYQQQGRTSQTDPITKE